MLRRTTLLVLATALAVSACADTTDDAMDAAPTAADAAVTEAPTLAPAPTTPAGPSAQLQAALEDVGRVAPALESFYRGGEYPRALEDVIASLADAGLELAPGNSLGAYAYDEAAVEFELCVEHEGGAFATYDTAPMSLRAQGETGGCPAL